MTRVITIGAAQLGPIQKDHSRQQVVARLIDLMRKAHSGGCDLVVFPELALTTFFPRWFVENISETDHYYETEMPSPVTAPLFDEAKKLGCFVVGLDGESDVSIAEMKVATENLMVIVGSEGKGLARLTREKCDLVVSIPISASTESLNASVATSIALYAVDEARRKG